MKSFKDMTVLVTGGAGFIGSHITDYLMNDGAHVRVIDDMSNGSEENYAQWKENSKFEIVIGDLRSREVVAEVVKDVSVVFHEAAKVSVPVSVRDPESTLDVNVRGTTILLDECRKAEIEKIVVASSSSVYGDTPSLPKVESMRTQPISPYGVSKLGEESLAVAFHRTYGLNTTALRYFNVYGPRQRGGSYAGVISIFMKNSLSGKDIPIEGDGEQTRDFTYVTDVAKANVRAAVSGNTRGKIYNVGSGSSITINSLADLIIELAHSDSKKVYLPPRAGDVHDSLASTEDLLADTEYQPSTDIRTGLSNTLDWVRESLDIKQGTEIP